MKQKNYCEINTSTDPKIIGRRELPLPVEIKNKIFFEQRKKNTHLTSMITLKMRKYYKTRLF